MVNYTANSIKVVFLKVQTVNYERVTDNWLLFILVPDIQEITFVDFVSFLWALGHMFQCHPLPPFRGQLHVLSPFFVCDSLTFYHVGETKDVYAIEL